MDGPISRTRRNLNRKESNDHALDENQTEIWKRFIQARSECCRAISQAEHEAFSFGSEPEDVTLMTIIASFQVFIRCLVNTKMNEMINKEGEAYKLMLDALANGSIKKGSMIKIENNAGWMEKLSEKAIMFVQLENLVEFITEHIESDLQAEAKRVVGQIIERNSERN